MLLQRSKGFTLIELITVIIILGVLAVSAAPRFFEFAGDARRAALQGMQGAMKSSLSMVTAYAQLKGAQNQLNYVLTLPNGDQIVLDYGYPEHSWETAWRHMLEGEFAIKTAGGQCETSTQWCVDSDFNIGADVSVAGASSATVIWPNGVSTADNCYVYYAYSAASRGNQPSIGIVDSGC